MISPFANDPRGVAISSLQGLTSSACEAQAAIQAVGRLNQALADARRAGWTVAVTLHERDPASAQSGPFREVRAVFTKEV